eukprot:CAMPEP_0194290534 /NCGR_PEP_ID=MMETSP0169-20130528/41418_1 /TAXON_ID=218684 /ORGANISM="Corethron pennatum, Strain L29A3" /LENGTH=303 /DNA_ID=CAMNT_0039038133 /DNA_START=169 /DNA_END=1077 /DNA_ORIENTATION=+
MNDKKSLTACSIRKASILSIVALVCVFVLSSDVASASCGSSLPEKHDWKTKRSFSRGDARPVRTYSVYTPKKYRRTKKSKVILFFHGWGETGRDYIKINKFRQFAERYNYVIVAMDGLGGSGNWEYPSWTHSGSSDGIGADGTVTACDTSQNSPDYCYTSQCACTNRCGWTQCVDDDVGMVADFLIGGDGTTGSLSDVVCTDPHATFAVGISNGGMFVWNLARDPRTSGRLAGIAPIIGTPHCGYDTAGENVKVPVLLQVGSDDKTVSANNLPMPGKSSDVCITNRDGDGYNYLSGHRITTTW